MTMHLTLIVTDASRNSGMKSTTGGQNVLLDNLHYLIMITLGVITCIAAVFGLVQIQAVTLTLALFVLAFITTRLYI